MPKLGQIRGALLEEVTLFLLQKTGYKTIRRPEDAGTPWGLRMIGAGLAVRGRGAWHQIDALAESEHAPAFIHPIRLLVEAKCHADAAVDLGIVRNAVGTLRDITENHFVPETSGAAAQAREPERFLDSPMRYSYHAAIISSASFTRDAVDYAVAHQVFLIDYKDVPLIRPVVEALLGMVEADFDDGAAIREIRESLGRALDNAAAVADFVPGFSASGRAKMLGIRQAVSRIGGSYFGMLQGRWPMHFVTQDPLPATSFSGRDTVRCRVLGTAPGDWRFIPSNADAANPPWQLPFALPPELVRLAQRDWENAQALAETKGRYFSFITLSGEIGGVRRTIRLELDQQWMRRYLTGTTDA